MVGSGGPSCPNCPHKRSLTSLRSQHLVESWEAAGSHLDTHLCSSFNPLTTLHEVLFRLHLA